MLWLILSFIIVLFYSVGKKLLFWFFMFGFERWQKPNVQFVWLARSGMKHNGFVYDFVTGKSARFFRVRTKDNK